MATPGFDFHAPPFDLLDAAARARVEAALDLAFFAPGTVLIEAGQPSTQVYVVLRGEVEAGDIEDGRERLFSDYGPGEVFGAFAVITGRARHRYRARGEVLAFELPAPVFRALLENNASEQGARMTAMDNATRNAGDMIKRLTLSYNRQRQASITKELIEIISGAEAV